MLVQQIWKVCNNSCYLQTCSAVVVAGVVTVIIYSFHSNKVMQSCRVFYTTLVLPLHVLCIFPRNVTFIYDQTTLLSEEMKVSVNSLGTCPSQGELRQWVSSSFLARRQCGLIAFCLVETKSRCLLLLEAFRLLPRPTSFCVHRVVLDGSCAPRWAQKLLSPQLPCGSFLVCVEWLGWNSQLEWLMFHHLNPNRIPSTTLWAISETNQMKFCPQFF